jgi:hypothetical protein
VRDLAAQLGGAFGYLVGNESSECRGVDGNLVKFHGDRGGRTLFERKVNKLFERVS